ncbi:hypothetical protein OQJ13_01900 [Legionella sp. PATHC035]|uniref:hypothetical protein n=1 Tax=Legionella sp. PATHC035 TaxID=2992040 RepID=UPI0022449562|nr:hypothetical protein [Legionella sp. PATHC035]MCW8407728.1 hypothetical protein [Legionella sp. PATHC035]
MTVSKFEKYAFQNDGEFYASMLWIKLLEILDPPQAELFLKDYGDYIPLNEMVKFTQEKFLRKSGQRWALENYNEFDPTIKSKLERLLRESDLLDTIPMPHKSHSVLFLGTSSANIFKRAFHLYNEITLENKLVEQVIVLGNTEPYDSYIDTIKEIISLYPNMFRDGFRAEEVPSSITMHDTMMIVLDNLNWPEGKKPAFLELAVKHPCNTNDEINTVTDYLSSKETGITQFGHFRKSGEEKVYQVTILSHQPFNDRQGITALAGFIKAKLTQKYLIEATGCGLDSWPQLTSFPASNMSAAQILDNLARTLYEINQNKELLPWTSMSKSHVSEFGL